VHHAGHLGPLGELGLEVLHKEKLLVFHNFELIIWKLAAAAINNVGLLDYMYSFMICFLTFIFQVA
jgi:hypothetical protein